MTPIYTPPPPARPVSPPPPPRPVTPPPSRALMTPRQHLAARLARRRHQTAAIYGAAVVLVPILGAWIASAVHHKAPDSDALTFFLVVGLIAYCAMSAILTPSRRERQLRRPQ